MRLYCLASISKIPPPPLQSYIQPKPYDEGADEVAYRFGWPTNNYFGGCGRSTLEKLPSDYRLTEISIGIVEYPKNQPKAFEMEIYQTKSRIMCFKMLRGFASITNLDKKKGCFDLYLATSKQPPNLSPPDFDLKICGFCIRNPNVEKKPLISEEEELAYNDYAERILHFCELNPNNEMEDFRIKILQQLGPLILPKQSTKKVFNQRLTDFETLVNLLCDPISGSYKNVTPTIYNPITKESSASRIYQIAKCLLYEKESRWSEKRPYAPLNKDKDKFRECIELVWENVNLNNKIDFSAFNFQNLRGIHFENVFLGKELEFWHRLAEKINFKEVNFIGLKKCGIQKLDEKFFKPLTTKLGGLRLMENDITFISNEISLLTDLSVLDLNGNRNLTTVPWSFLPSSIRHFELEDTNITEIPKEIGKLKMLRELNASSRNLNHISWFSFKSRNMKSLNFCGSGAEINEIDLRNIDADELNISSLKFTKFDFEYAFRYFSSLHLIYNGLKIVKFPETDYNKLRELTISGNQIEIFSWKHLSKGIERLNLSSNNLKAISQPEEEIDFSSFKSLKEISFENNEIRCLPKGFENLPVLQKLNLSFNNFGHYFRELKEKLWDRLPKSLICLNLIHNQLDVIPCCLRNFKIENLHVADCNLHYICPYLHTKVQQSDSYMVINAIANDYLKLSFIPSTIYPFPKSNVGPITGERIYNQYKIVNILNYANFPTTTLYIEKEIVFDTSRIYRNNPKAFVFYSEKVENLYACNCCAMCGDSTNNPLFKQVMTMDSILLIRKENGIRDEILNPSPIYYKPGMWKSKITSRLCDSCKKMLEEKIKTAYAEFENDGESNESEGKKKKKKEGDQNELLSSQPQTLYNTTATPVAGPSSSARILPSINTLLHPQERDDNFTNLFLSYDNPSLEDSMEMSIDNLPFEAMEIDENPITAYNVPETIILLNQQGEQICYWKEFSSGGRVHPILTIQEQRPFDGTFLTQNATPSAPSFNSVNNNEILSSTDETLDDYHFTTL